MVQFRDSTIRFYRYWQHCCDFWTVPAVQHSFPLGAVHCSVAIFLPGPLRRLLLECAQCSTQLVEERYIFSVFVYLVESGFLEKRIITMVGATLCSEWCEAETNAGWRTFVKNHNSGQISTKIHRQANSRIVESNHSKAHGNAIWNGSSAKKSYDFKLHKVFTCL